MPKRTGLWELNDPRFNCVWKETGHRLRSVTLAWLGRTVLPALGPASAVVTRKYVPIRTA